MKKLKQMLPYILIYIIAFFLVPLVITNKGAFMLVLLAIFPVLCIGLSIMYGAKYGFDILYVVLVPLIFAITIFIYYNITVWVYIVAYLGITILGNAIGGLIRLKDVKRK